MKKLFLLTILLFNLNNISTQNYFKFGYKYNKQILGFGLEENSFTSYIDSIEIKKATSTSFGTGGAIGLEYSHCYKKWLFSLGIAHFNSRLTQNKAIDPTFQRISTFDYIANPITLALGFKENYNRISLVAMFGSTFRFNGKVINYVRFFNSKNVEDARVKSESIDKFNIGFDGNLNLQYKLLKTYPLYISCEIGLQVHNLSYDKRAIIEVVDRGVDYTDKLSVRDKYTEYLNQYIESKIVDSNKPFIALKNYYTISSFYFGVGLSYRM